MNLNTTTGKAVKTLAWIAVSAAVTAVAGFITQHPDLFNPVVVGLVNVGLVVGKNYFDKSVKNI